MFRTRQNVDNMIYCLFGVGRTAPGFLYGAAGQRGAFYLPAAHFTQGTLGVSVVETWAC